MKAAITLLIWLLVGLLASIGGLAEQTFGSTEIPTELHTSKLKTRNPTFAISVESVLQKLREKQEIILIDIRKRNEFEKFRIPGSINIPLFAIKTKVFLKSRYLVLVNEGYNYSQPERECGRLRKAGFRVWILNGGLYYWRQKGAPLEGDIFAQNGLNRIPPRIFFTEKDYEDWIVIDVSSSKNSEAPSLIPQSISIPYMNDNEQFILTFKRTLAKYKDNPFISVLLFTEKGEQYDKTEKVIQKTGFRNIFFLKDGIEAYKKFLKQQVIIRHSKHNSRKTLKKCANCP